MYSSSFGLRTLLLYLRRDVHATADASIKVPMQGGLRSLNVAVAAAMVTGEALRQLGGRHDARTPLPTAMTER